MPSLLPPIQAIAATRPGRTPSRLAVALLLLALAPAAPRAQAARAASPVVGTWQVVEWWVRDGKSGDRQYPYGRQPAGLCVYDATGHVVVHVTRSAGDARGESRWRSLSQDDLRKLVSGSSRTSGRTPSMPREACFWSTSSRTSCRNKPAACATCRIAWTATV